MNRKSYSEILSERYVEMNNENSRVINYDEMLKDGKIEAYFYDELPKKEIKGFPFASDFANAKGQGIDYDEYSSLPPEEKKKYRLRYLYLPLMHELYIGTTGSGKTTTCIEPQIRAVSYQKNKPNLFVSDPKGELFLHNARFLKKCGYNVQILNFKNVKFSNCWNPLEEMYDKQMQIPEVGKGVVFKKGHDYDKSLTNFYDPREFVNDYHLVYDGAVFPSYEAFNQYVEALKNNIHSEITVLLNQLVTQMFPDGQGGKSDPMWNNGAREYFAGCMLALLEDAIRPEKKFTKEKFTLKTVNDIYTLTCRYDPDKTSSPDTKKFTKFLSDKSKEACDKIQNVSDTYPSTKKGFLSTCQSMIGKWMNGHIFSLINHTDISLDDKEHPIALFIVTRDYDRSDNVIAGLFLNWVYRQFLEKAEKEERKDGISGGRPMHFMLDEFANIPAIPDFETKIATSRSRNMWFHLYIQSYEQLKATYVDKVADIIVDNCNQQTFLGSQSVSTKKRFSDECGQKTVKNLRSTISGNKEEIVTLPVVPISDLNNIKTGWMFVKRNKMDVIKSTYVRSYQCANEGIYPDFFGVAFEAEAPLNLVNPFDKKYLYPAVIPDRFLKKDDEDFLGPKEEDDEDEWDFFGKKKGGK